MKKFSTSLQCWGPRRLSQKLYFVFHGNNRRTERWIVIETHRLYDCLTFIAQVHDRVHFIYTGWIEGWGRGDVGSVITNAKTNTNIVLQLNVFTCPWGLVYTLSYTRYYFTIPRISYASKATIGVAVQTARRIMLHITSGSLQAWSTERCDNEQLCRFSFVRRWNFPFYFYPSLSPSFLSKPFTF